MGSISAIVTMRKEKVAGGAPIFVAQDADELNRTALLLEKIIDATAHDLKDGTIILVKHGGK